jgi:hypothetical protein
MRHRDESMTIDLFISYASEDKDAIARPLAQELRSRGWTLWFDEVELTLGDSLTETINRGLAEARFGVVILSPRFFDKDWPRRELNGLTAREMDGARKKVILPVWHKVDYEYVLRFSPPLADRLAAQSTAGVVRIADQIERVLTGTSIDDALRDAPPRSPAAPERFPRPELSTAGMAVSRGRLARSQRARQSGALLEAWLRALQLSPGRAVALIVAAVLAGVGGYELFASEHPQPARRAAPAQRTAPGDQFDAQLRRTLTQLNARRLSARKQMAAARNTKGQAAAADKIASAYRKAALDVRRLKPPVDSHQQATVLHDRLVMADRTFKQLASAARAGRRRTYDDRRSAAKAREAAINRVLESLSSTS